MPNLVALGQIIRASVWVSKILQMVGLCPLGRGISDPLETLHFPTLYVAEFGRPRSNSQCLITQILRTDTETKHGIRCHLLLMYNVILHMQNANFVNKYGIFGTPLISLERLKVETSYLVGIFITTSICHKMINYSPK